MLRHQIHNSLGNYTYNAFVYSNRTYAEHFHKNYELIYTVRGPVEIRVNRTPVCLQTGELLLLSPYVSHSFTVSGEETIWVGVFSGDFVRSFASKYKGKSFSPFRLEPDVEEFLKVHLFFQGVPELYPAKACLYLICDACVRGAVVSDLQSNDGFRSRLLEYIDQNLAQDISLRSAAADLGYEYHYFSKLFHDCFELNFKEFLNILRFDLACQLLESDPRPVTEIAEAAGFASIRNFNRIFKSMSGNTPSQYRALYHGGTRF